MSETSGSLSNSSSGPKPSNSSTSTFSSANCSRRFSVTFNSASTSMMIGRNSSDSSSLVSVAAASGSTRSSRRGSTCSLILWTLASKPPTSLWPEWVVFIRSARRDIASPFAEAGAAASGASVGSGGNCSPPSSGSGEFGDGVGVPPRMGLATPNCGRAPALIPAGPFFRPNALIAENPRGNT